MKHLIDCRSLYVGGPISLGGTLPPEQVAVNLQRFFVIEFRLQQMGFSVFNPARLPKFNRRGESASQADYLEQCIWMIMQSDGMVVLEGWELSPGTINEVLLAQITEKPVFDDSPGLSRVTSKVIAQVVAQASEDYPQEGEYVHRGDEI